MIKSSIYKDIENIELHLINFEEFDNDFKILLDNHITLICEGTNNLTKLKRVKLKILEYLEGKIDDPTKVAGWIAELFCHLYLNQQKFKPGFLFINLEEINSMKKGFDGIYSKKKEYFIFESKSTLPTTKNANHLDSIKTAFKDISDKIGGKKLNKKKKPIEPWTNAIRHLNNTKISGKKSLISQFDEFSDMFYSKKYLSIQEFNIIPSSTIYLEEKYCEIDEEDLKQIFEKNKDKFYAKKNLIMCVNQKSYDFLKNYLNE